jgi:hypothetical protein
VLEKERGRRYRFFEAIHFPDYHSSNCMGMFFNPTRSYQTHKEKKE